MKNLEPVKGWSAHADGIGIIHRRVWRTKQEAQNYVDENLRNATYHVRVIRVKIVPVIQ